MFVYIKQLEQAVSALQSRISSDPHPLLAGYPSAKSSDSRAHEPISAKGETGSPTSSSEGIHLAEVLDAISLKNESGTDLTKFHGPTATSEVCFNLINLNLN